MVWGLWNLLVGMQASLRPKGPPHSKWDLLSYPNTSQVLRLFNQNGVSVGSGFELSEGFRHPLTSRAIKVL